MKVINASKFYMDIKKKNTIRKIIREMAVQAELFEKLPRCRKKEDKMWNEGFIFGLKYSVINTARMLKDPKLEKLYQELIGWKKAVDEHFGKNNKAWQEHKKEINKNEKEL